MRVAAKIVFWLVIPVCFSATFEDSHAYVVTQYHCGSDAIHPGQIPGGTPSFEIANHPDRIGYRETWGSFGNGSFFEYGGTNSTGLSEVLHLFSLIQSSTKGVFLRTRDYANYRIKQNHCGGDKGVSEEFDWGFGMSYPGFRIAPEFAGFQISVYLGDGGSIDWDEVVVPDGLKVVDEREMPNADNPPQQTEKERK